MPRTVGQPPNPAVMADEVPLESDDFWVADPSVLRLRACHVMAWTAGLAALALVVPARYAASPSVRSMSVSLLVVNGLILAVAVLATAWNPATARGGKSADRLTRPLLLLRWISLAVLAASLVWVAVADVGVSPCADAFSGFAGRDLRGAGCPGGVAARLVSFHRVVPAGATPYAATGRRLYPDRGWVHRTVRGADRLADRRRVQRRRRPVGSADARQAGAVHRGGKRGNHHQGNDTSRAKARASRTRPTRWMPTRR